MWMNFEASVIQKESRSIGTEIATRRRISEDEIASSEEHLPLPIHKNTDGSYFFISNVSVLYKCEIFTLLHNNVAAVFSLLQAANEISSRGEGKDRDINVVVQRRYEFIFEHYAKPLL